MLIEVDALLITIQHICSFMYRNTDLAEMIADGYRSLERAGPSAISTVTIAHLSLKPARI